MTVYCREVNFRHFFVGFRIVYFVLYLVIIEFGIKAFYLFYANFFIVPQCFRLFGKPQVFQSLLGKVCDYRMSFVARVDTVGEDKIFSSFLIGGVNIGKGFVYVDYIKVVGVFVVIGKDYVVKGG